MEIAKKHKSKLWRKLKKKADEFDEEYFSADELIDNLRTSVNHYVGFNEAPNEIRDYLILDEEKQRYGEIEFGEKSCYIEQLGIEVPDVFDSRILPDINDVIIFEPEQNDYTSKELSFQVITLTEKGTSRFYDFVKSIPHIRDTVKEVHRRRKTHSSRYTFRPYPLAVSLWLDNEKAIAVPEDLRDFLKGSISYHSREEWRTSIVLSAICVESVLADLFEEEFKQYAPNVPLGELYNRVKSKIDFPLNVSKAIEVVNEARISAVHRSRFPVSDREATNALFGSTTFIMWYSSNY